MKSLNLNLFFQFVFIVGVIPGCCGTKIVRCNNNEPVAIYKCPEKQYQQYVKTIEPKIKATIDLLEKVKIGNLDIGTKSKITTLRDTLDQYSSRMQDLIKASFLDINSTPCDRELRREHKKLLSEFGKQSTEIERLKNGLVSSGNQAIVINNLIDEYNSNDGFRTCNRNPTDNFYFYFITESNNKLNISTFTLPFSDVKKSESLKSLLTGFLKYLPIDAGDYLGTANIYRMIDEKKVKSIDEINLIVSRCNTGMMLVPQKIINSYDDEHMAFTIIKSMMR